MLHENIPPTDYEAAEEQRLLRSVYHTAVPRGTSRSAGALCLMCMACDALPPPRDFACSRCAYSTSRRVFVVSIIKYEHLGRRKNQKEGTEIYIYVSIIIMRVEACEPVMRYCTTAVLYWLVVGGVHGIGTQQSEITGLFHP